MTKPKTAIATGQMTWALFDTGGEVWSLRALGRTDTVCKRIAADTGRGFMERPKVLHWTRPDEDDYPGLDPEHDWVCDEHGLVICRQVIHA